MRITAFALIAVAAAGCSKDDIVDAVGELAPDAGVGGPVMVDITVDDATEVGDLTEDEQATICEETGNAINAALSDADRCDFTAAIGSVSAVAEGIEGVRARCAEILEPCQDAATGARALGQDPADAPLGDCALFRGGVENCTVTVAKLEECLQDVAVATTETARAIDCNVLSLEGALDAAKGLGEAIPNTAVCIEVQQDCPGIFEGPEMPDGGVPDGGMDEMGEVDAGI